VFGLDHNDLSSQDHIFIHSLLLPSHIGSDRRVSVTTALIASTDISRVTPACRQQEHDMALNYIIEVRPRPYGKTVPAGIVVRDGNQFRFFVATHAFDRLERQLFKNPKDAEKAALRQINDASMSVHSRRSDELSIRPRFAS
jgi:hypothetical protein